VLNATLINPIGKLYLYSDLNFITLGFVVGNLARTFSYIDPTDLLPGCDQNTPASDLCYFEAYTRKYVIGECGLSQSGYLPPRAVWPQCAPTENDTAYRHTVMQGQVHDENAYAAGGISGHAGLFSTATDMYKLMARIMFATPNDGFINSTTAKFFTAEYNHSQSSRALGWNTNDPTVDDRGWNQSCGSLSPKTWMHVGFTGTLLCGDPDRQLIAILLTNRVYPDRNHSALQIRVVRNAFGNAVQQIVDKYFTS